MAAGRTLKQNLFSTHTRTLPKYSSKTSTRAMYISTSIILLLGSSMLLGGLFMLLDSIRQGDLIMFVAHLITAAAMFIVGTHMVVASIASFILQRRHRK